MALGTGLRRGDIESLKISDIDYVNSNVTTRSKKTRKSMGLRPVPLRIMEELKKYVSGLILNRKEYSLTVSTNTDGIRYVTRLV